jgi:hypothetical protein
VICGVRPAFTLLEVEWASAGAAFATKPVRVRIARTSPAAYRAPCSPLPDRGEDIPMFNEPLDVPQHLSLLKYLRGV